MSHLLLLKKAVMESFFYNYFYRHNESIGKRRNHYLSTYTLLAKLFLCAHYLVIYKHSKASFGAGVIHPNSYRFLRECYSMYKMGQFQKYPKIWPRGLWMTPKCYNIFFKRYNLLESTGKMYNLQVGRSGLKICLLTRSSCNVTFA